MYTIKIYQNSNEVLTFSSKTIAGIKNHVSSNIDCESDTHYKLYHPLNGLINSGSVDKLMGIADYCVRIYKECEDEVRHIEYFDTMEECMDFIHVFDGIDFNLRWAIWTPNIDCVKSGECIPDLILYLYANIFDKLIAMGYNKYSVINRKIVRISDHEMKHEGPNYSFVILTEFDNRFCKSDNDIYISIKGILDELNVDRRKSLRTILNIVATEIIAKIKFTVYKNG